MKYMISIIILLFWIIQIKSDKASQVIEFAKSKIGCGYVWGAVGEILTPEKLKYFVGRHPEHVNPDIVKKWMGMQVFDCAGLVHASFATVGIELNKGATSIWGQKKLFKKTGKINTLPTDKVCILFREDKDDKTKMAHTGIYVLNGDFVHAAGSKEGVQPGKMSRSTWTHWALPKDLYEEIIVEVCSSYPCKGKVANADSGRVNLREGPDKSKKMIMKINVGEIVTLNSYQDGWYYITYGKNSGYMMADYIVKP